MNLLATAGGLADQVLTWTEPIMGFLHDLPQVFTQVPPWQCAILIPLGLVSLLYGLKLLKAMVIIYLVLFGAIIGWYLSGYFDFTVTLHKYLCLVSGALILGAGGWLFVQVIFGMLGGIAGALAGVTLLYTTDNPNMMLIAAGVGLVVGIVLAAVVFRALVVATTAVFGAHLVVTGIVVLLYYVPQVKEALVTGFASHRYLLPVLIGIPAVLGIVYQAFQIRAGENK